MNQKQGVYVITDSVLLQGRLVASVEAAVQGGAQIVQYRDKSNNPQQRFTEAQQLKQLCQHYNVPLIINDDLALAAQLGVGVHLGQQDGSIAFARQTLGKEAIIGATCHNSLDICPTSSTRRRELFGFWCVLPFINQTLSPSC
jgi:thiamine-phosphate pyrophosphorylase